MAKHKTFSIIFMIETPQGLPCLTITVPLLFGNDFDISNAEKISE